MSTPRTIPGVDGQGFISGADLRGRAARLSNEEFTGLFFAPALWVRAVGPSKAVRSPTTKRVRPRGEDTERSIKRTLAPDDDNTPTTNEEAASDPARYHDAIGFLVKRPGNPFPQMISIGRAMNNDLVVVLETISKMHGYFLLENGGWCYTDNNSTNGSSINGAKVPAREKRPIREGDVLRPGLEIEARFFLPSSLHAHIRSGG